MNNFFETLKNQFGNIDLYSHPFFIIDIFFVAIIFYYLYIWSKNTRVLPVITGLMILGVSFFVSRILDLKALQWLLDKFLTMLIIAIPIVFSDELKRFLEKIGNTTFFNTKQRVKNDNTWIDEIIKFTSIMKINKKGALIVIERSTLLTEYIEDGKKIDSKISKELLLSIFETSSPLHDGAIIIRNQRIASAGCILPISREIIAGVGTRHHAGLSISNKSDAFVIINSEERGEVSIAFNNVLFRNISELELKHRIFSVISSNENVENRILNRIRKLFICSKI